MAAVRRRSRARCMALGDWPSSSMPGPGLGEVLSCRCRGLSTAVAAGGSWSSVTGGAEAAAAAAVGTAIRPCGVDCAGGCR